MSVRGEFGRLLSECVAFLSEADPPDSAWIAKLENAAREGRHDLTAAASDLLRWLEADGPLLGASELQREEFARRLEHLAAICRAITGGR